MTEQQPPTNQQPPQNGQPYYVYPQPPQKKKHTGRTVLITLAAVFVVLVGGIASCSALVLGGGGDSGPAPAVKADGGHHAKKSQQTVTFKVTGTAPGGVDLQFGSDHDTNNGGASNLPWSKTVPLDTTGHTNLYTLTATTKGGSTGDLAVQILVNGKVVANGHASGQYAMADATISQDFDGTWSQL